MAALGFSNVFLSKEYTSVSLRKSLKELSVNSGVQQTFSVLYHLSRKKGYAFARQTTLAEMQGINSRTVSNHIRILKELGFIEVVRRGSGQTAKYYVKRLSELKSLIKTLLEKTFLKRLRPAKNSYQQDSPNYSLYNKGLPLTPSQETVKGDDFHTLLQKYPNKKNLHKALRPFRRLQKEKKLPSGGFSILIEKYQRLCRLKEQAVPELWRWLRYGWFETVERELLQEEKRLERQKEQVLSEKEKEDTWLKESEDFDSWLCSRSSFFLESMKKRKEQTSHSAIPFEMWLRYEVFFPEYKNQKREGE